MRKSGLALLYTAAMALANQALSDVAAAELLRDGDMRKLVFSETAKSVGDGAFMDFAGAPKTLRESDGKWRLVNFWATWCAPCRKEMPSLSALQTTLGGADFDVITIATSRNPPAKMKAFFDEIGVDNLPLYRDPKSSLARQMGVLGLPVTLILNPEGQEVARLTGDADWASDEARALLEALVTD